MLKITFDTFMHSLIENCRMMKRNEDDYLKVLLERLWTAKEGEDLMCCLPCHLSA